MNKRHYLAVLVLGLASGFLGGVVSARFMSEPIPSVFTAPMTKMRLDIVEAEEFRVVDKTGAYRVLLGTDDTRDELVRLQFRDRDGKERASLEVFDKGIARLDLLNPDDKAHVSLVVMPGPGNVAALTLEDGTLFSSFLTGTSLDFVDMRSRKVIRSLP